MIEKDACFAYNSLRRVFKAISRLIHGIGRELPNKNGILLAVGIEGKFPFLPFFSVTTFATQLDMTETSSTRLLNGNTYQYAAKSNSIEASIFYVSIYIALRSIDSQ